MTWSVTTGLSTIMTRPPSTVESRAPPKATSLTELFS